MSELNINDLSVEILIKVFRCLDTRDLKNVTLTCKSWNNFVVSEFRWSVKLSFDMHGLFWFRNRGDEEEKINFILTTNRKFGTIEIMKGHLTEDAQIYEIFQCHGLNVVKLCCCGGRIDNLVAFAELLRLTPNLKHAYMSEIVSQCVGDDVALSQYLPDLKKLTYLEMDAASDQGFINCFKQAKLTAIKINDNQGYGCDSVHNDPLVQFLVSQEMLTSLTVEVGFKILVELGKLHASIPFRLTQLALIRQWRWLGHSTDEEHLLRFVQSQAESLKELEMGDNIPSVVLECAFASMRKLNTLTLRIDRLPWGNEFYKRLNENCSVHTMKLLDAAGASWWLREEKSFNGDFFKKFPNVRSLTVVCSGNNRILAMAQNLSKLESLSISTINYLPSMSLWRFSNLKTLEIQYLRCKINWNEFTKIHSRLTELTIGRVFPSLFTSVDIDQITTNVDLQTIRLGVGFVANDRFFEIIRAKCTNLKVLDIHKSCISRRLRDNVEINVLRLCDEIK